jgi:hypothetical protein
MIGSEPPLVSVVIPCYRQAHFLAEAIESVLRQSYPRHEIIVVDDGSPDHTAEVAAAYPAVRYIWQENQGLPAVTRNRGLAECRGEYVVFLDADDRLLPRALEAGVEAFSQFPESAFICGHTLSIVADGAPSTHRQRPCAGVSYLTLLERNAIEIPGAVMYRRAVLVDLGGYDSARTRRVSEDYGLNLRIAHKYPVHCHHELVAEYRQHDGSLSQNHAAMLGATIALLERQKPLIRGKREYEAACMEGIAFYRRYYGEKVVNQLREHVRHRSHWREAARMIGVLVRFYPRGLVENAGRKLRILVFGAPAVSARRDPGNVE